MFLVSKKKNIAVDLPCTGESRSTYNTNYLQYIVFAFRIIKNNKRKKAGSFIHQTKKKRTQETQLQIMDLCEHCVWFGGVYSEGTFTQMINSHLFVGGVCTLCLSDEELYFLKSTSACTLKVRVFRSGYHRQTLVIESQHMRTLCTEERGPHIFLVQLLDNRSTDSSPSTCGLILRRSQTPKQSVERIYSAWRPEYDVSAKHVSHRTKGLPIQPCRNFAIPHVLNRRKADVFVYEPIVIDIDLLNSALTGTDADITAYLQDEKAVWAIVRHTYYRDATNFKSLCMSSVSMKQAVERSNAPNIIREIKFAPPIPPILTVVLLIDRDPDTALRVLQRQLFTHFVIIGLCYTKDFYDKCTRVLPQCISTWHRKEEIMRWLSRLFLSCPKPLQCFYMPLSFASPTILSDCVLEKRYSTTSTFWRHCLTDYLRHPSSLIRALERTNVVSSREDIRS